MTSSLTDRFRTAYHKIYGIIPEILYDGTYYRSPHLPSAMSPRLLQSHVIRLETRCAEDWEVISRQALPG